MSSGDHRKMCRLLVLYFCIPKMFNCRLSRFGCRGDVWGVCWGGGRLSGSFHSLNLTILPYAPPWIHLLSHEKLQQDARSQILVCSLFMQERPCCARSSIIPVCFHLSQYCACAACSPFLYI